MNGLLEPVDRRAKSALDRLVRFGTNIILRRKTKDIVDYGEKATSGA